MDIRGELVLDTEEEIFILTNKRLFSYKKSDINRQVYMEDIREINIEIDDHVKPTRDIPAGWGEVIFCAALSAPLR